MTRSALILWLSLSSAAVAAPALKGPEGRGLLVLDDSDPDFKGKETYGDTLSYYDPTGRLVFQVSGFNNAQSVGSQHRVAVDRARRSGTG